ncbi:MAG: pyridoxamine 5-phosphate oxidase-related, FMN-binding protein [Panacagrimonas sp.]|jgi:predicted pyridoxine 5'-phosphate oxidase superfamily flavin-nucleotide-binding protein|nr:pyridoxamine 5'-phosphate oxidase family protein [Panacagrimonas sp.]MCC2656102.1 pyridoxamine 5-phosphate oxidase-related, FMN-binding protein [Panacagrimonas sp.]
MDDFDTRVFHEGEQAVQQRIGVRERIEELGRRVIRDHMPDQHREFFGLLPFIVIGALDAARQPWATVLAGPAGFMQSPDPKHLVIDARPAAFDPLADTLTPGAAIGLLGIQPHTRRRNRMNGIVVPAPGAALAVAVSQSFGNCPKYIQAREPVFVGGERAPCAPRVGHGALDAAGRTIVAAADTFYIATAHPEAGRQPGTSQGFDVSHRGGKPGFVKIGGEGRVLTVPDFVGNFLFNTIGNLSINPRAGLLFIDFANGDLLYVAARGSIVWDGPEVQAFAGAQRLLRFEIESWRRVEGGLPLRWSGAEPSPFLAPTGDWA